MDRLLESGRAVVPAEVCHKSVVRIGLARILWCARRSLGKRCWIMSFGDKARVMGNVRRGWRSCWLKPCIAAAVLLIAPPAFAALSVSIACNDFESTGTSSCNYFLDGPELSDIARVEVFAKDSVSGWKSLVAYQKKSYGISCEFKDGHGHTDVAGNMFWYSGDKP